MLLLTSRSRQAKGKGRISVRSLYQLKGLAFNRDPKLRGKKNNGNQEECVA